jgi:hypothetical protein
MKKTFTLLFILVSTLSFAQLDWSVKSIDKPTNLYTNPDGTTSVTAQVTLENLGDVVPMGDSITLTLFGIRRADRSVMFNVNLSLILPSDAAQGYTLQTPEIPFPINAGVTGTDDLLIAFGAVSYQRNRTNPTVDVDSTNNVLLKNMSWRPATAASTADLTYDNNISAHPNPANTELNVSLNYTTQAEISIELINLNGQVVINSKNTNMFLNENKLDLSSVEKGIYILKVTNGDAVYTRRVAVAH